MTLPTVRQYGTCSGDLKRQQYELGERKEPQHWSGAATYIRKTQLLAEMPRWFDLRSTCPNLKQKPEGGGYHRGPYHP